MAKSKTKNLHKLTVAEHHMHARTHHSKSRLSFIDKVIIFSGPLVPIAVFIQAYNVWILNKREGLSIVTWVLMLFASATLATYAIHHRTKSLMLTYIPLVVANALVVCGILLLE